MIRYLIVGILVTTGLVGIQLYMSQSVSPTVVPTRTESLASPPALNSAADGNPSSKASGNVLADANPISNNPSPERNSPAGQYTPAQQAASGTTHQPWEIDDEQPQTPDRFLNRGIDARPLKMDRASITAVGIGDRVQLKVPQTGQDYEMSVQEVGRHANGDRRLTGHLVNSPNHTVIMTEGQQSTFATINTPDGSFVLEANGDQGWMLSMNDLDAMIDPNLVDYQIPDISRQVP